MLPYLGLYLSMRSEQWGLRLASLKMMAPIFHAFDCSNYINIIPNHLAEIKCLPPTLLDHFRNGAFVANIKGNTWSSIALDESHEIKKSLTLQELERKTEPSKVVFLRVFKDPADNADTMQKVLDFLSELFQFFDMMLLYDLSVACIIRSIYLLFLINHLLIFFKNFSGICSCSVASRN